MNKRQQVLVQDALYRKVLLFVKNHRESLFYRLVDSEWMLG
jgi:hypothetical protein